MKNILPIETDRLLLDRFKEFDRGKHFDILDSREYQLFNCSHYEPSTEEEKNNTFRFLLSQNYEEKKVRFVMALRLKESDAFIGHMGLKNGTLEKDGSIELYFGLSKEYWNNGYGTEALKATISFCFDKTGIHRIFAGCDIDNFASARIMEKVGMIKESRWRKDRFRYGQWKDGLGFSILKEDYYKEINN
ncbi:MAG: GNAT family protein [Spirochaetaceae bacterium]|nr:GNAT family protein [Spirochaetaceae bacterium]